MTKDVINYVAKVWIENKEVHQFDMFVAKETEKEIEQWIAENEYSNTCQFWHPWAGSSGTLVSLFVMDDDAAAHFRLQWEELAN